MLHLKRDTSTSKVTYKFDGCTSTTPSTIETKHPPTPMIVQPNQLSFTQWSTTHNENINRITDSIMQFILEMNCEKYIMKIKNYDALKNDIQMWVYKSSANTQKHY